MCVTVQGVREAQSANAEKPSVCGREAELSLYRSQKLRSVSIRLAVNGRRECMKHRVRSRATKTHFLRVPRDACGAGLSLAPSPKLVYVSLRLTVNGRRERVKQRVRSREAGKTLLLTLWCVVLDV